MASAKRCKLCSDENVIKLNNFTECPVCLSHITDPPVYMCARSHIFCEDCHISLKKDKRDCPVCKGDLAGNRNLFAERMLDSLPKTHCKNDGCSFKKVDLKKVQSHEDVCQYRLIKCLICKEDIPLINLGEHQWNEHEIFKLQGEKFGKVSGGWSCPFEPSSGKSTTNQVPLAIKEGMKTHTFFLNYIILKDGSHLHWISQSQSKKDIQKYKYSFSILCGKAYDDGKIDVKLVTYFGICIPVDVSIETIKRDIPCIPLPKVFLQKAIDKNKHYHFEFCIDIVE